MNSASIGESTNPSEAFAAALPYRLTDCLQEGRESGPAFPSPVQICVGAIPGEGIGPEVIESALMVLEAVTAASGIQMSVETGGAIGRDAERKHGSALPLNVVNFCGDIFSKGGAVLCGPGGGRFVYDLRKAFDLFFKISPLRAENGLPDASSVKPERLRGVDILLARENCGGVYQGAWSEEQDSETLPIKARHEFGYSAEAVRRFLAPAARLARSRSGRLTVVWKESGVPSISRLWKVCAEESAASAGVELTLVDIDLMAYRLIHDARAFDVIAAPNLFGDVLGDLGAVLLGARGNSYSGNFSQNGRAIFQTNHGSAYDLTGTGKANPAGQIFSAAMMLRESFGLCREAAAIEAAVRSVWSDGWRTPDVASPGKRPVTTLEMARRIAERACDLAALVSVGG